ncbi:MAG TPA: DUF6443 domain-containing protein [Chryseolinea sp.]|nr:DUF6443 domain-containing protein [Chryseolinea sp.]
MKWFQPLAHPLAPDTARVVENFKRVRAQCLTALFFAVALTASGQTIVYVKKGATGAANGTSWTDAYPELTTALTAAVSISGNKEIWVANGEYKPTSILDRTASFVVTGGMSLYGGFAGNETSKEGRNWRTNRTVLSGDLGKQFDYEDNSYHVLKSDGTASEQEIDGFSIAYGHANGTSVGGDERSSGAGFYCSKPGASVKLSNVIFESNRGIFGAGIAIYLEQDDVGPLFVNCEFKGNNAQALGAAIITATYDGTHSIWSTFINCSFSGNSTPGIASICANLASARFLNCNATMNQGSMIYTSAPLEIENSIFWKNFTGPATNPVYVSPIDSSSPTTYPISIKNSIVQGGYGSTSDNNLDLDPLFVREPSFVGVHPRTSILPVSMTNPKYENQLEFNGPRMLGLWPYVAFHDHNYNKTYLLGSTVQVLDYNNLVDNKPTGTIYSQLAWPRTQRPDRLFHTVSNSIKFAVLENGIVSVNRQTGAMSVYDVTTGESGGFSRLYPNDAVVDNVNNLLYCPVFASPANTFYGILELNLTTQAKRWITTSSSPVSVSGGVALWNDEAYWGGLKIFLDDQANVLYFSTGNGVWWWNRTTSATGLYNTNSGIPVTPGNPQIPSNLTTAVYVDNTENKVYIGTHQGLYVWDRNTNSSRVYNTTNSKLIHNLINTIDKNEERHLIYVACEDGALLIINTQTGEETLVTRDAGSPTYPQYMDVSAASAFYDEVDKKLYVSADHTTGGTWIADYNNLVPDYGDLRLQASSPAIDKGNHAALPSFVSTDISGLPRFTDYPTLSGTNSLDLGAYERSFEETDVPPAPIPDNLGMNYVLSYTAQREGVDASAIDSYATKDVNRTIQYFDGLGRPLQSIAIQGSPTKKDIVTPIVYDEFGRETRKYLPFTKDNGGVYIPHSTIIDADNKNYIGTAANFYAGQLDPTVAVDANPFSETVFEPSPLNRPLKDYGPGAAWKTNDKPITHQYLSNAHSVDPQSSDGEAIIAWKIDAQGVPTPATAVTGYIEAGGFYSSNQLSIKVTKDEEGHAVREYTNKQGQVILKKVQAVSAANPALNNVDSWACTYYIYDDLDNLVFVLQPEGYKQYRLLGQN